MPVEGARTLLRRLWDSPRLIPTLSVLTVLALAAAAFAVFGVLAQDDARERDRIAVDLAACDRVNILRRQVIELGEANETAITSILDIAIPEPSGDDPARDARIAALRAELAPVLADLDAVGAQIELTDCTAVTRGATVPPEGP